MADILIGSVVKGVAAGIGLASESIQARKAKNRAKKNGSGSGTVAELDAHTSAEEISGEDGDTTLQRNDEEEWELDEAQDVIAPPPGPPPFYPQNQLARQTSDTSNSNNQLVRQTTDESQDADKQKRTRDLVVIVEQFVLKYPLPQAIDPSLQLGRLAFPVILPQRRPKSRSRGFVRAYAPALAECGITQPMFLDFLKTFDQANEASPWINAINLAGIAGFFTSHLGGILITIAIQVAMMAAREMDSRRRTNSFLDKMNDQFYRPRGLYAMVLTWNPESSATHEVIDINSKIASKVDHNTNATKTPLMQKFKTSSGDTYGDFTFPETAPLVFPELDSLAEQNSEEAASTKEKLKAAKNFTSEYMDKRARAKYRAQNPESFLAQSQPEEKFLSRYSDPNHPASSGNIFSLVTGGHFNPPPLGRGGIGGSNRGLGGLGGLGGGLGGLGGRLGARQNDIRSGFGGRFGLGQNQSRNASSTSVGAMSQSDREAIARAEELGMIMPETRNMSQGQGQQMQQAGFGLSSAAGIGGLGALVPVAHGIKKILGFNVLYLMIVNMPSDEEMEFASKKYKKMQSQRDS